MRVPLNDLTRGIARSFEVQEVILQVLKSGKWIHGAEHALFESELASYVKANFAFGVASGTDALELALRAVGCGSSSRILTTANAGGYSTIAAKSIGCELLYCDINPNTLLMDPKNLLAMVSMDISAVIVTHLYGNVASIKEIIQICQDHGIKVIEDCAQAMGAHEDGTHVGTFGDVGTFSFYPTKNLGAIGDAGALVTNSSTYAEKISSLRQYGWSSKYEIANPGGMNSRLDEIQAAVLRIGLRHLDSQNLKRIEILKSYEEALLGSTIKLVTSTEVGSVGHLAVLKLPGHIDRAKFREKMNEYSISTDIHYPILDCDQSGLSNQVSSHELVNSRVAVEKIVSIPLFPELTHKEIVHVCNTLKDLIIYFGNE